MMKGYIPDPRARFSLAALFSLTAVMYSDPRVLMLIGVLSLATAQLTGSNILELAVRFWKLLAVIVCVALVQSLLTPYGSPVLMVEGVTLITDYGLLRAAEFFLRMVALMASGAILAADSARRLVQGLIQLRCPYEIAFMVYVAIRFLPLIGEEIQDMFMAVQLRAIDLKKVKLRQKLSVCKYMLLPVVAQTVLRARELSAAMEMRAFRAFPRRTSYISLSMCLWDYAVVIGSGALLILSLVLRFIYSGGML